MEITPAQKRGRSSVVGFIDETKQIIGDMGEWDIGQRAPAIVAELSLFAAIFNTRLVVLMFPRSSCAAFSTGPVALAGRRADECVMTAKARRMPNFHRLDRVDESWG